MYAYRGCQFNSTINFVAVRIAQAIGCTSSIIIICLNVSVCVCAILTGCGNCTVCIGTLNVKCLYTRDVYTWWRIQCRASFLEDPITYQEFENLISTVDQYGRDTYCDVCKALMNCDGFVRAVQQSKHSKYSSSSAGTFDAAI